MAYMLKYYIMNQSTVVVFAVGKTTDTHMIT